ncbi:MAG: hypothetical protein H7Z75_06030 [Ferruginibacter sp.]|nr:hypothetical protein [Cytophagales bacterium]
MSNLELIDRYLDQQLPPEQVWQLEKELRENTELREQLDSVRIVREAVQSRALNAQMKDFHRQFIAEVRTQPGEGNGIGWPKRPFGRWVVRIAASLFLGVLGYGAYQYSTLDAGRFYAAKFLPYQLPTTRSDAKTLTRLDSLYRAGNSRAVVELFEKLPTKGPRDYFLTGMAHLRRREFNRAIVLLSLLRQQNRRRAANYFDQETDYYLALAYLGAHRVEEAYPLFKKIYDNPRHLYHQTVTKQDLLGLQVLDTKQ